MTEFLSKEQVDLLDKKTAEQRLRKLEKNYKLDKPLHEQPELHPLTDHIANTLLYLEDRIRYLTTCEHLDAARPTKKIE